MADKTKKAGHLLKPHEPAKTHGRSLPIAGIGQISAAIDPSVTRIAVELLSPEFHGSDITIEGCLQSLRELLSVEGVLVLLFDEQQLTVQRVLSSCTHRVRCNAEILLNKVIPDQSMLLERLTHQRLLEIRDVARPRHEYAQLAACFARFNAGSMLISALTVSERIAGLMMMVSARSRSSWEMDTHLVLKLVAANYSAGLERYRVSREFAYLQLRNELAMKSAHDGLWDFDLERNTLYLSPRWKAMALS